MIVRKIIDTFYDLARQHNLIRSFTYDRVSTYEAMYLLCRVAERVARMKIND